MARSRKRRHAGIKQSGGQPRLRSLSARAAWERGGAGPHGKSHKAQRRATNVAIQKGDTE